MSIVHDIIGKPTPGEIELREKAAGAQAHAEMLEERLLKPDPLEFTDPSRHVAICFERQIAAHAWRRAMALHIQLVGAENRRYSRGQIALLAIGFSSVLLFKGNFTLENLKALLALIGGL